MIHGRWKSAGEIVRREHIVSRGKSAPRLASPRGGSNQGLVDAAQDGSVEQMRRLLAGGADPNFREPVTGSTPLHAACRMDFVGCADLLIGSRALIDARRPVRRRIARTHRFCFLRPTRSARRRHLSTRSSTPRTRAAVSF